MAAAGPGARLSWSPLAALDPGERQAVLRMARRRRFAKREVVFHEGDPGDSVHLVETGRLAARITTPRGDVVTFTVIGPGEAFGELTVLGTDTTRSATVVALERASTWALDRELLADLRARHPMVERMLTEALARHVKHLSQLVMEALHLPAEKRVARRLLDLAARYATDDGAVITLTQEDIANMAGTSRATVNRVLSELAAAGAVTVTRGRITVDDAAAVATYGH